jgi:cyclic-di-GMP-binding protein
MPSFDIVSKVQMHEVDNAVQQASKEVGTRYDFRDSDTTLERGPEGIMIESNSQQKLDATLSVLQEKLVRRKVSLKAIDPQPAVQGGGDRIRQLVKLNQGIASDKAKEVVKFIKTSGLKVQASIQEDQVRVTGKKRDDLQSAIQAMRAHDFGIDLQFENYRD